MRDAISFPRPSPESGYNPSFLPLTVELPLVPPTRVVRDLRYTHFTVMLDPARRLAAATAVNIDGASILDTSRSDEWHLDARIPPTEQTGPEVYAGNDLDRGHLVRRRDPVWGDRSTALRANGDTFVYTNAAPQAARFNQAKELWAGLEDYVLGHARKYEQLLTVFTGPVLGTGDPSYRGIGIPLRFWKIAVWFDEAESSLASTGYLLDQTPQLNPIDLEEAIRKAERADAPPPLGPFRTFQLPVTDIERLTELNFGSIAAVDRMTTGELLPGGKWHELGSFTEIRLDIAPKLNG